MDIRGSRLNDLNANYTVTLVLVLEGLSRMYLMFQTCVKAKMRVFLLHSVLNIVLNQVLFTSVVHEKDYDSSRMLSISFSLSHMPEGFTRCPKVHDGDWRESRASWLKFGGSSASWIHSCRGSHKVEFHIDGLNFSSLVINDYNYYYLTCMFERAYLFLWARI